MVTNCDPHDGCSKVVGLTVKVDDHDKAIEKLQSETAVLHERMTNFLKEQIKQNYQFIVIMLGIIYDILKK